MKIKTREEVSKDIRRDLDKIELRSSLGEVESFLNSRLWGDMQYEIGLWLTSLRDLLEVGNSDDGKNVGRADACRRFLELPYVLREELNERKEIEDGKAGREKGRS